MFHNMYQMSGVMCPCYEWICFTE